MARRVEELEVIPKKWLKGRRENDQIDEEEEKKNGAQRSWRKEMTKALHR